MNVYADLIEVNTDCAKYKYGPEPDQESGVIVFDRQTGTISFLVKAEGIVRIYAVQSLMRKMKADFDGNIFKEKYAREVG